MMALFLFIVVQWGSGVCGAGQGPSRFLVNAPLFFALAFSDETEVAGVPLSNHPHSR